MMKKIPDWFYNIVENELWFWILSATWGILLTLSGFIVSIPFFVYMTIINDCSFFNQRGHCVYFTIGKNWGGFSLGPFCFVCENASINTLSHEHGHSLQNCLYGPFSVIFSICSMIRYHYRNFREKINKPCTTKYDDFWFEGQASSWGNEFFNSAFREN